MWRPDRSLRGPDRPTLKDIEPLNRVFADAFTDRYSRDGLVGVRVPHLNTLVWRYALEDAGDGAMIWRDADGTAGGVQHGPPSGTEGWMGPLAVRPDRQGEGLGSTMVRLGIDWLKAQGARTIGLETMPRTVENIGFYSRLGLVPGPLTVTLVHDVPRRRRRRARAALARGLPPGAAHRRVSAAHRRARAGRGLHPRDRAHPRPRHRRHDAGEGRRTTARLCPLALHSARGRAAKDEVRVLKLVARSVGAFERSARAPCTGPPPASASRGSRSAARPTTPRHICGWWRRGTGCTGPIFG